MRRKPPQMRWKSRSDPRTLARSQSTKLLKKKLIRKIDFYLIPILFLLLMAAFLDRINIGNARIMGLEKDLHMKGNDFNIALFVFFVPYILLEVPSNLLMKKVRPSMWLSGLILGWGTSHASTSQPHHIQLC
jgi:hypothetical protein